MVNWRRGDSIVAAPIVSGKGISRLIVAERRSADGFRCGARGWAPGAAFSLEGGATSVAFDLHLEDRRMVDEAIDGGERHGGVGKDLAPFAEGLIGRDEDRAPF